MGTLLHDLVFTAAQRAPEQTAIKHKHKTLTYQALAQTIDRLARGLRELNLGRGERVAVYLPKYLETVAAVFGTSLADGVIVPINPVLKPDQVGHILRDCNARILITAAPRLAQLHDTLKSCHDLHTVITLEDTSADVPVHLKTITWHTVLEHAAGPASPSMNIDHDIAAILYTSGSTGKPKGVVLSHQNMIAGAHSVTRYLNNTADDRLLAVLPFSFDYGLSQLTTAFTSGASVVLMDYLLPREVLNLVAQEAITGLAAVPALWIQLAEMEWPEAAVQSLRYITNSGGAMPHTTVKTLQRRLPNTSIYLMYGLTEAFRSTYLPPDMIDHKRGSIGKAIPNAEIMVVREDGTPCAPNEPGELVHRGALVAKGYWNQPEKTAERFRPAPAQSPGLSLPEIAVWSGDTVVKDEEGYLYFVGRRDEMIKTSGYRVSPTEIEEVLYESGLVGQAVCLGLPHPTLGQGIVAVVTKAPQHGSLDSQSLLHFCKQKLPNFMVPLAIFEREHLPRNPNGKIDRKLLHSEVEDYFSNTQAP
ncbi:MAG: acyl-CoA ligase (AMP-forming), exosortase A system-associated [Pseudomonadota bacterium]